MTKKYCIADIYSNGVVHWDFLDSLEFISDMKGVPQDNIWHAEGDVYIHVKNVVSEIQRESSDEILILAALFHDIEKRSTTKEELIDGVKRITAKRHAKMGEFTTRKILFRELNYDFEKREEICKLVRYHGVPTWGVNESDYIKRAIESSLYVSNEKLIELANADVRGRISVDNDKLFENIKLYEMVCREYDCINQPYNFHNSFSRLKYLNESELEPTLQLYEDFEFEVILLSGLPGMGKDTYYKNNLSHLPMVSLDDLRRNNKVRMNSKKESGRMIQDAKELCKVFLRKNQPFVFNATNITKDMRAKWLSLFRDYNARTKIIYIEKRYDIWGSQNKNREHVVPDNILEKMLDKLEIPSYDEAFDLEFDVH